MKPFQKVLDRLNHKRVIDTKNLEQFHGSGAVRNLWIGKFQTRDGDRYEVDPKTRQIRKISA